MKWYLCGSGTEADVRESMHVQYVVPRVVRIC